jgi:hypothetical protein
MIMSAVALPVNLGAVADVADSTGRGGRFTLEAVQLSVKEEFREVPPAGDKVGPPNRIAEKHYRAAATDTKVLMMVEGECGSTEEIPGLAAVLNAPNSATSAMVPYKEFKKVFADATKKTKKRYLAAACKQVVASLGKEVATFGCTDTESEEVKQTTLHLGLFPNVDDILNSTRKKKPVVKISFDPNYLAKLAKIAAGYCDDESQRVDMEIYGESKPAIMTVTTATQKVTMLIMPLAG